MHQDSNYILRTGPIRCTWPVLLFLSVSISDIHRYLRRLHHEASLSDPLENARMELLCQIDDFLAAQKGQSLATNGASIANPETFSNVTFVYFFPS